ncbi:MAG: DUF7405 family protein [Gaiellaceae bacterium]
MSLTRRQLLAGAAAGTAGAAGIYELVDRFAGDSPSRPAVVAGRPEQHVLDGLRVRRDDGIEVVVPPLHHSVVTARVRVDDLPRAQRRLEDALRELERRYPSSPAGVGITVAWGLPYFRERVPRPAARLLPSDLRARKPALLDAMRFPSDPAETVLEANDAAVLLRSDDLGRIEAAERILFDELDVWERTSVRRGFAGGGLPKKLATAAGIRGADLIPDDAELFLGFTSTLKANLGPERIANLETLGLALVPDGYFRGGTHMALAHIEEDLEAWYINFPFGERVSTTFRPGVKASEGTLTIKPDVSSAASVKKEYGRSGSIGHSSALQTASRLQADHLGEDGTLYRKGTAIPLRADFNTLDNPFFDRGGPPAAGVHFVIFNPTSDDFHRTRLAMDGVLPDGSRLPFLPRSRGQGFNQILRTTHRQNFLVPPREHRSFPLAELTS